ncbi:hypothetical protein [Jiella marina]|uniref:hypothetical protein n=1 Tax=Jiella sp. LLJ827 TaxID=2917712 RepID=UPI0021017C1F|nr:hypothetical protein [Jiella sp. LLJ827]MCQ0986526.1 hypothetical protein [Jiella sp. LLJ827]
MRPLFLAASVATALTLTACGDDNAARVTELEGQLQTAQTENEALQTQVQDLEAAQQEAAEAFDPETLREPLTTAFTALGETEQQLNRFADALAQEGYQDVSLEPLRANVREASQAVAGAARDVGVDVDAILAQAQSAVEGDSESAADTAQPEGGEAVTGATDSAAEGNAGDSSTEDAGTAETSGDEETQSSQ